jgi:hypothetical protein
VRFCTKGSVFGQHNLRVQIQHGTQAMDPMLRKYFLYHLRAIPTTRLRVLERMVEVAGLGSFIDRFEFLDDVLELDVPALRRPRMMDIACRRECEGTFLCGPIECLGQDADDIKQTVNKLRECGIKVFCAQIDSHVDLTSLRGKPAMAMIDALSAVRASLIGRRVTKGREQSLLQGGSVGRNIELSDESRRKILHNYENCWQSVSAAAEYAGTSRQAVYRLLQREGLHLPATRISRRK